MIYLDNNATTPLDPEVLAAMMPYLTEHYGNASSGHAAGVPAREAVNHARSRIAALIGCEPREVIFTSGGTEANHLAIRGTLRSGQFQGKHIVIGGAEHPCVTKVARAMEAEGYEVSLAPVTEFGEVTAAAVKSVLRKDTALVSVMHAQNEVGTVNNLEEIGEMLGFDRILFHTDAAQSVGKLPTTFPFMGVQLMSIAAHKFYGPKGVGALIAQSFVKLAPDFLGGAQQDGRRAGTENVPGIVGLAKALELCFGSRLQEFGETVTALRDYVHLRLSEELRGLRLNGHIKHRLPTTLNLSFEGITGADLARRLDGICISTGSACHDSHGGMSETFAAMGLSAERHASSVRISFGRTNTVEEADEAVEGIARAVRALREASGCVEASLAPSTGPECPRCAEPLAVMSTSGGLLMKCRRYDSECRHLLPLPGTRPPE